MLYKLENDPINKTLKKQKYKEDLDFLVNLKNQKKISENMEKYQDKQNINNRILSSERETESIISKDKLFYNGLRKKYVHDIQNHKDNQVYEKQNEILKEKNIIMNANEKIRAEDISAYEQKMNKIKQQYVDMADQRRIKQQMEEKEKIQEYYNNKKNYEDMQSQIRDNYGEFKRNVNGKNMKVYDNMAKYSNYVNSNDNKAFYDNRSYAVAIDPKQFKNDQEYNRNLSNFKEYEKKLSRNNMLAIQEVERQEETKRSQEIINLLKKEKSQNTMVYKNILDQQVNSDKYIREKNKVDKDDFDGSLLPSYVFNVPSQPIYKKASDSLQMFKENMFRNNGGVNTNNSSNMNNMNNMNYSNSPKINPPNSINRSNNRYPDNIEKEYENKKNYMLDNKNYYLGESTLGKNTIINPSNYSISSNKQLNMFRQQVDNENKYYNY